MESYPIGSSNEWIGESLREGVLSRGLSELGMRRGRSST
jgi:hypothetical protein